ncbi:MAG: ArsR/SmtB family transcription factor [Micromonosporaceae bacterium]
MTSQPEPAERDPSAADTPKAAGAATGPDAAGRASLEDRLAHLEERVSQLESGGRPAGAARSGPYPEKFWALEGLKQQADSGAVVFAGVAPLPTGEHYEWQQAAPTEQLLSLDWSEFSGVLGALGHPVRLLLVRQILGGVRTVAQLQQDENLGTTGQLYHHLRQLVAAGWLKASGRGRYVVPAQRVVPLLVLLAAAMPVDHSGPETVVDEPLRGVKESAE